METYIFLLFLLFLGVITKNNTIIIATAILIILKTVRVDTLVFPLMSKYGIMAGITILTITVLLPIASGQIGMNEFKSSLMSYQGWISVASGIIVAILAKNGVTILADSPVITTSLVFGTIIGVAVFSGVSVGPLIGAGIAYVLIQIVEIIINVFS